MLLSEFDSKLVLEDGRAFAGRRFGARTDAGGEVVFNTAMSGYQEILTDPSYAGQLVTMTSPQIVLRIGPKTGNMMKPMKKPKPMMMLGIARGKNATKFKAILPGKGDLRATSAMRTRRAVAKAPPAMATYMAFQIDM